MGAVRLESVWISYRGRRRGGHGRGRRSEPAWGLQDVSLAIAAGERLGVMGGNGSGKTTLLRTVSGLYPPSRGTIAIRGHVASVIDITPGIERDLSGRENLRLDAALHGLGPRELRRSLDEILDFAAIAPEALDEAIYTYSAGMLLRLRLALALSRDPDVLVVDEVLAVADRDFRARCMGRFDALRRAGSAVVLASHDLTLITEHTDRVVVLEAGRLSPAEPAANGTDGQRPEPAGSLAR